MLRDEIKNKYNSENYSKQIVIKRIRIKSNMWKNIKEDEIETKF